MSGFALKKEVVNEEATISLLDGDRVVSAIFRGPDWGTEWSQYCRDLRVEADLFPFPDRLVVVIRQTDHERGGDQSRNTVKARVFESLDQGKIWTEALNEDPPKGVWASRVS